MRKGNQLSAAVLIAALALPPVALAQNRVVEQPLERTISILGLGEVQAMPDMALVTIGVSTEAETAAAALSANSAAMTRALETLRAAGLEARDLQTSGLALYPRYSERTKANERQRIVGYSASNGVTARVRKLADLGPLLDRTVAAGANQIRGIVFDFVNRGPLLDQARKLAVADAKRRAELYAQAAGVRLGPILSISEETIAPTPRTLGRMAAAAPAPPPPIESGELSLSMRVNVIWKIAD